jgi:SAM-dependent methyltransferase
VAADTRWVLSRVPEGPGRALDLGGGPGELCGPLTALGYEYVNLDLKPTGPGAVVGDAHELPFEAESFDLVVSNASLAHFHTPLTAIQEVARVLKADGRFVVWVPFMRPFTGGDYYRYTPRGLKHLFQSAGFSSLTIEAPLAVFTVLFQIVTTMLRKVGLPWMRRPLERIAAWLDGKLRRVVGGKAYAPNYLVEATK